jgi:NAD(P)H-flavin reductase
MLILQLKRPALFRFKPGQYAYPRVGKIDMHWHPFSIASDPSSPELQFYVEVHKEKSCTGKNWTMLQEDCENTFSYRQVDVEILGPIGTPLAKTQNCSRALAIGTGGGIVPILSLFTQQVQQSSLIAA